MRVVTYTATTPDAPWPAIAHIWLPGPVVKGVQKPDTHHPIVFSGETEAEARTKAEAYWDHYVTKEIAKRERIKATADKRRKQPSAPVDDEPEEVL